MKPYNFEVPSGLAPIGYWIFFINDLYTKLKRSFIAIVYLIFKIFKAPDSKWIWIFSGLIILLIIINIITTYMSFKNFRFYIKDQIFYLNRGWLKKSNISIPFQHIQQIQISQNFLQNMIGVVELKIDTAGDDQEEVKIVALEKERAGALKMSLLQHQHQHQATKIETVIDDADFIKIGKRQLLLVGITQNHFRSFLLLSAIFFGFYHDIRDLLNIGGWYAEEDDLLRNIDIQGFSTILLLIIFIIVASSIYSILMVVLRNYGLKFKKDKLQLHIYKGLFTNYYYRLTRTKIQGVIVQTNLLKKKLNLNTIWLNQTESGHGTKQKSALIGLANLQINQVLDFVFNKQAPQVDVLRRPLPFFKYVLMFGVTWKVVLINLGILITQRETLYWLNLILIPYLSIMSYFNWKQSGYNLSQEFLISKWGSIDSYTLYTMQSKVESVKYLQNFIQKRKGVASLMVCTATDKISIPYIDEKEAWEIYNWLLYKVEFAV